MKTIKKIGFFISAAIFLSAILGCGDFVWRDVDVKNMTISNLSELKAFRDRVNGGYSFDGWYIELVSDIDLSGVEWQPIGEFVGGNTHSFAGTFNGRGNVISGLTIDSADDDIGFFRYLDFKGTIKNLGLYDVSITGGNSVGSLIGVNLGTIENCYAIGKVLGTKRVAIGGLIGANQGTIRNCYTAVVVGVGAGAGTPMFGGFAGVNFEGHIENSYSAANPFVGGNPGDTPFINSGFRNSIEMREQSTFAAWDFVNTWGIDPNINDGYPHLLKK
jgi:hypothetical protein